MNEINLIAEIFKYIFMLMGVIYTFQIIKGYLLKPQVNLVSESPAVEEKVEANVIDEQQITAAIATAIIHHDNYQKQIAAAIAAAIIHHNNKG